MSSKVRANLILEVLGKPVDHLKTVLEDIVEKLGEEKDVEIVEKTLHEPKPVEKQEGFFTTFAEITIEVKEVSKIFLIAFKYMPSHTEIESPEKVNMDLNDLNQLINELTRRLHAYDHTMRVLQNQKKVLEKKLVDKIKEEKKE